LSNRILVIWCAPAVGLDVHGGDLVSTKMLNPVGHVGMALSLKRLLAIIANDDVELAYAA